MPTYEYECEDGHTFEFEQSIHDEPLEVCILFAEDTCGPEICGAKVKKLINFKGAIRFKGGGWTPKFHILLLCLLFGMGCVATTPQNIEALAEYPVLRGKLAAAPSLEDGGHRLFIYLEVKSEVEDEKELLVVLAYNEEEKFQELRDRLIQSINEPIFIYATPYGKSKFEEIVDYVDYKAIAVGYYVSASKRYRHDLMDNSPGTLEAMRSIHWGKFILRLGKAGVDKAL